MLENTQMEITYIRWRRVVEPHVVVRGIQVDVTRVSWTTLHSNVAIKGAYNAPMTLGMARSKLELRNGGYR
jgi:hypothetical protein